MFNRYSASIIQIVKNNNHKTLKILIADDVPSIRKDLRTLLTLVGGLEIVGEAINGEEAVRLAGILNPNVVLMDLEMPVLDGFEATRRIKELYPKCRVVALTIHGGEEEKSMAYLAGVDVFVVKGAPVKELIAGIRGEQSNR
jgi:DNA-binding NarL/FixJ family response regulator